MNQSKPFVITISRQFGSGGAFIGQQLAKKLNIYYADHEIISKAAEQFSVSEGDLNSRDEKLQSFWDNFKHVQAMNLDIYLPPKAIIPTTHQLFEVESEIIRHIANERSAVIIGRCGFHILREHSNLISIFLLSDIAFRSKRIQELYNVSKQTAMEMVVQNDKERARYIETFTGKKWTDARLFDLSVDTSKIGIDKSVELILNYIEARLQKS